MRLSLTVTLSHHTIWHFGQKALFLFFLAKVALAAYLPTALSLALWPLFRSQQAQYVQIFSLKPAPFCTLFADLGSTNKSATSLLSDSLHPILSSIFPLISISQADLTGTVFSPCTTGYSILLRNDAADELARRAALLVPSVISCSLSRIHSSLFSDWRRTVSSKFFDTQVPSISTEELVLPRPTRCVLSRLRWNGHSLLLSFYLSRIGRIENSSCSACGHSSQDTSHLICTVQLRTLCTAHSLHRSLFAESLSLYDLWSRPRIVARLLGLNGLPPCPHPSKGSGNNNI